MKPRSFRYHAVSSRAEAVACLAGEDEDARVLAGGQSLVPMMNLRFAAPSALVDINGCDDMAEIAEDGDALVFGARVRQRDGELSELVKRHCPLVAKALAANGHPATRHRGTVGGTLAHADPGAELPAVALALGATFTIDGINGKRVVTAEDFFVDALMTTIEANEMLVEVRFPKIAAGGRAGLAETAIRSHDLAVAGVVAQREPDATGRTRARVAAFGVSSRPFRLGQLETALDSAMTAAQVRDAVMADLEAIDILDNLHATADYRRSVTATLAERALVEAGCQL